MAIGTGSSVDELAHELATLAEHLDPIVHAVAHVDQTILRQAHAVHRIAELRRFRVVVGDLRVVGPATVRAPVALVGTVAGVEHDANQISATATRGVYEVQFTLKDTVPSGAQSLTLTQSFRTSSPIAVTVR